MDRRSAFISVVLIVAAALLPAASGFAQGSQSNGFVLAHVMNQRDTVTYKITQQLAGSRTLPGASQAVPMDCTLTSTVRLRLVKALGDGNIEVAAETQSATLKLAGKDPRNIPASKEVRIYRITPSGKPVETTKGDKVEAKPVTRSLLDSAWIEPLVLLAVFPDTAVSKGSDWTLEIANPLKTDDKSKISAKLEDVKQAKEGWIATIKETLALPTGQTSDDNPIVPGSRIQGELTLKYLSEAGRLFAAEGAVTAYARTQMGVPGLPKGDLPMGSATGMKVEELSSKFTVETVPPAQK